MRQIVLPRSPSAGTDPDYVRGVVLVALAGGFWSLGGLLVRLVEAASGWQIILFRSLALALTLLLIIGLRNRGRLVRPFRNVGFNGAAAGIALSGGFIGFVLALEHTSVANATFMLGASPFFAALLGRLILGERVRRLTFLAMVLTAIGIIRARPRHHGGATFSRLEPVAASRSSASCFVASSTTCCPAPRSQGRSQP